MSERKKPEGMGLGDIVKEIVTNQASIQCLIGKGLGDHPAQESNTPLRHELEQRQEQFYIELNKRETYYR